ncbi:bifunctional diaminohydroxyphosphoribosylaminopyrimidine deaminase/5-amino-6-(5-phosphoribosylamino)uracil reductase RibD [Nesterenkonia massiliensis]|uniref:bifunctional diaminohydroxyphosphoribosylaminopyrimidine deaminase/5-amino-6-(5-phosphoribosylamino)uracil reductase RibD n=1 Tax=Nesterenkonia massiliensis TaxID=1232429 RepID=UPI0003F5A7DA|nr:bifunctional diaminohydroxyphosphoribosylaminopyrimidine deaminase/5-amino-6-(5-phosphoribosylamino)uracil reductase RibD [Nesterenkonia massiliensis]
MPTADADNGPMRRALEAAQLGPRGANPLVGAVLTDEDGTILATGHHRGAGTFHAERDALRAAHSAGVTDFSRTTLYTTLEPCRHRGRQPACTDLIQEAGVPRVVTAAADPSANGGGAALLAGRGLDVVTGVLEAEATELNHRWNLAQTQQRPFVTVHLAQTLDAKIAAADGTSQWITSEPSRRHTHRIRQRVDAILVGTNTAHIDNPRLTARNDDGGLADSQPLRCVMGLRDIPEDAILKQHQPEGDGWIQLRTRDPLEALRTLAGTTHGGYPVKHVLVEGGQSVLSAFFAADLVDEVFAYVAPMLLGVGRSSLGDIGVTTLAQARRFALDPTDGGAVSTMDSDVCIHLKPEPEGDACSPES